MIEKQKTTMKTTMIEIKTAQALFLYPDFAFLNIDSKNIAILKKKQKNNELSIFNIENIDIFVQCYCRRSSVRYDKKDGEWMKNSMKEFRNN